jgi:hypothetical protein
MESLKFTAILNYGIAKHSEPIFEMTNIFARVSVMHSKAIKNFIDVVARASFREIRLVRIVIGRHQETAVPSYGTKSAVGDLVSPSGCAAEVFDEFVKSNDLVIRNVVNPKKSFGSSLKGVTPSACACYGTIGPQSGIRLAFNKVFKNQREKGFDNFPLGERNSNRQKNGITKFIALRFCCGSLPKGIVGRKFINFHLIPIRNYLGAFCHA